MLTKAQLLHYTKMAQHSRINLAYRTLNKVLLASQALLCCIQYPPTLFWGGFIHRSGRRVETLQLHNEQHISFSDCSSVPSTPYFLKGSLQEITRSTQKQIQPFKNFPYELFYCIQISTGTMVWMHVLNHFDNIKIHKLTWLYRWVLAK